MTRVTTTTRGGAVLRRTSDLIGYTIHATDGDIGSVSRILFDDDRWTVRYVVVDTGKWLPGRKVLISPISIRQASWSTRKLDVALTRDRVKNSPDIDTDRPVSRQQETAYFGYYGYPYYWGGAGVWGASMYPNVVAEAQVARQTAVDDSLRREQSVNDSHLRDTAVVRGYHIRAMDGEIGHVDDFLGDDKSWTIRSLVVDTSTWIEGRRVLMSPEWVAAVSWHEATVHLAMSREAVRNSPEYDASRFNRDYEQRLYAHYGRGGYWAEGRTDRSSRAEQDSRYARLQDLTDFKVADGDPDVRGWKVLAADGAAVGRVEHLIADRNAMTIRYLEVGLARVESSTRESEDVLIPVEHVDLDKNNREVRLRSMRHAEVFSLPRFVGLPIDEEYEQRLGASFGKGADHVPHSSIRRT